MISPAWTVSVAKGLEDAVKEIAGLRAENERLLDALQRSHKELLQYAWYEQGLTGLRERNEKALCAPKHSVAGATSHRRA